MKVITRRAPAHCHKAMPGKSCEFMCNAQVGKNGVSPFQNMCAYLGGSAIQTVGDNPVTAYRQLVQQYARPPRPSGI